MANDAEMVSPPLFQKTCPECGTAFTSRSRLSLYCSRKCKVARDNREAGLRRGHEFGPFHRTCVVCRSAFVSSQSKAETCSRKCRRQQDHRVAMKKTEAERMASRQKICTYCGTAFTSGSKRAVYCSDVCRGRAKSAAFTSDSRRKEFKQKHGVDRETLLISMADEQGGACYLCGDELDWGTFGAVHVDHDHACLNHHVKKTCETCRRGLACIKCNWLVGLAFDDPDRLRRIADNLEVANAGVRQRRDGALF